MPSIQENNKRIAKNTLLLYIRMMFLMLISLYTSRVILNVLGVQDFGIYNVVGGVVAMFSVLSSSLSSAVSRFLTFELGRKDFERLKVVFSTSVNVQVAMAVIVTVIAEVVGVWFLNYKMNIPAGRMDAATWVMHCSILSFAINLISVPYNASIVSHERMGVYAYISIIEAVLKLAIVFALSLSPYDKLVTYAFLLLAVSVVLRVIYGVYCGRKFAECKYHFVYDKKLLKEMTSFAGWNFFGNTAYLLNTQGVNILINVFFGVTLNAARGVAVQIQTAVNQFVNNFMTAMNPQITKSYAANDLGYMHTLVCRGAKYSFFLMLIFAIPLCIETRQILILWLKIVPDYSVAFVRLTFATTMVTVIGNTLYTAQLATGHLKKYQIVVTVWGLWVFPLTWVAFKLGMDATATYYIYFFIYFVLLFIKIYLIRGLIQLPVSKFLQEVVGRTFIVSAGSVVLPLLICWFQAPTMLRLVEVCLTGVVATIICIYYLGMNNAERQTITSLILKKLKHV